MWTCPKCGRTFRNCNQSHYCGKAPETIEDPLMQEIRYLDKLVDELAKGKPMEKIMRRQ